MANLKPTAFIKEALLKEAVISPEIAPGVTTVYHGFKYLFIKMASNSLGWIVYCMTRPLNPPKEPGIERTEEGIFVENGHPLLNGKLFIPTTSDLKLLSIILREIEKARQQHVKRIKTGTRIDASMPPTDIVNLALKKEIPYEDAIQFLSTFNPRFLVRLSRSLGPAYKIEELLIDAKESNLLADYAIRTCKRRLLRRAEEIIKLNPEAWRTYTTNLPK